MESRIFFIEKSIINYPAIFLTKGISFISFIIMYEITKTISAFKSTAHEGFQLCTVS